ncbi:MAG: nucleotide exchange factor GrpE [Candidatus Moranbacteria bacterium]|nr:nucleotide exchange factor GrpE [Candidatus Moranbacteria bacterium]
MTNKKEKYDEEMKDEKNVKTFIVAGVLLEKDGKYLLIQETKKKAYGLWNIPAGKVEKDSTIEETAIREAKEESGFDVELISKIGSFNASVDGPVGNIFFAKIVGGEQIEESDQILASKWFALDEIKKMKDELRGEYIIEAIELLESKNKTSEYLEGWKRCQADFENYKKRQAESQKDLIRYSTQNIVLQILPVIDNFHASTDHIPDDQKENAWVTGIMYIQKQLEQVLVDNGVTEIEVKIGDNFDPAKHEAIEDMECKGCKTKDYKFQNKIKKIVTRGYQMGEKVVRASRVIVE